MPFVLLYHPDVVRADLPPIPLNGRGRIADALAWSLHEAPERFGLPLRGTLKGDWKLRVGDYRVVYRIVGTEARILAIIHRRQVYEDVLRRIGWAPVQRGTEEGRNTLRAHGGSCGLRQKSEPRDRRGDV